MRYVMRILLAAAFLLSAAWQVPCLATPPTIRSSPVIYAFTPVSTDLASGHVRLNFTFSPGSPGFERCGELDVVVSSPDGVKCTGDPHWLVNFDESNEFRGQVDVFAPPNDTSEVNFLWTCTKTGATGKIRYFFVTTGDTVECWNGDPRDPGYGAKWNPIHRSRIDPDTLKESDWNKKYLVDLDLTSPSKKERAERYLGHSLEVDSLGRIRLELTFRELHDLAKKGIGGDFVEPPPWQPRRDSTGQSRIEDGIDRQGTSDFREALFYPGISLSQVEGMTTMDYLPANTPISFDIRINNTYGFQIGGISNGFTVYSPDGLSWGGLVGDTLSVGWPELYSDSVRIRYFGVDGSGADTVVFTVFGTLGEGFEPGFNEEAFQIRIGSVDESQIGKTICLDSARVLNSWFWSNSMGTVALEPDWGGPHCFTIRGDSVSFYGFLLYYDPTPGEEGYKPLRNCRIEMWDEEPLLFSDELLAGTYTYSNGYFEIGPVDNDDIYGKLDIFFRYYAENEATYVNGDFNGERLYYQTPTIDDIPPGDYERWDFLEAAASGPFFVADVVKDARDLWSSLSSSPSLPEVQVVLNVGNLTFYDRDEKAIHISSKVDPLLGLPDTWDRGIIYHEFGHYIEDTLNVYDASPGGEHEWLVANSASKASSEGLATFVANVMMNSPLLLNTYNNFSDFEWYDSESGECNCDPYSPGGLNSANNGGYEYEAAVVGMLWDIYDTDPQVDDWSTFGVFPVPYRPIPDGVGDTLYDGLTHILNALTDRYVDGHYPDRQSEFWAAWFQSASFGHIQAMQDIWYEHGEVESCCIGIRGNVDGSANDQPDVSDLVYLQAALFQGGPQPPCFEEADVEASGVLNVSDVTFLVAYLFQSGPAPLACP